MVAAEISPGGSLVPRIAPLSREELADFEPFFKLVETAMGFVPTSLYTMGRWKELLQAFAGLAGTVQAGGRLPPALKHLVSFVASNAAGCRYCQAHTSHSAERAGVPLAKIDAAFEFETSNRFDDAERAALRLARDAALVPSAVEEEHFVELRKHYSEEEIVELAAVISLFGWLNRWNDTMATRLESSPLQFAEEQLAGRGWRVGKHAP
jgi:uncharacterized peroxidase-related enzyme